MTATAPNPFLQFDKTALGGFYAPSSSSSPHRRCLTVDCRLWSARPDLVCSFIIHPPCFIRLQVTIVCFLSSAVRTCIVGQFIVCFVAYSRQALCYFQEVHRFTKLIGASAREYSMQRKSNQSIMSRWIFRKDGKKGPVDSAVMGCSDGNEPMPPGPDTSFPSTLSNAEGSFSIHSLENSHNSLNYNRGSSRDVLQSSVVSRDVGRRELNRAHSSGSQSTQLLPPESSNVDEKGATDAKHPTQSAQTRRKISSREAALLLQDYQSTPTTNIVEEPASRMSPSTELKQKSLASALHMPSISTQARRQRSEARSKSFTKESTDALDMPDKRRIQRMQSRSLSATNREELEKLADQFTVSRVSRSSLALNETFPCRNHRSIDHDHVIAQQEEELVRIALERSLSDSQSINWRDGCNSDRQRLENSWQHIPGHLRDDNWQSGSSRNSLSHRPLRTAMDVDLRQSDGQLPELFDPSEINTHNYPLDNLPSSISVSSNYLQEMRSLNNASGGSLSYHGQGSQNVDDLMYALEEYDPNIGLTQEQEDLLVELALEEQLQRSLSSFVEDDRSHQSRHSIGSYHLGLQQVLHLSSMPVPPPYEGNNTFSSNDQIAGVGVGEEEETILAVMNDLTLHQQSHPLPAVPTQRRVARVSSMQSQVSRSSQRSHGSRSSYVSQISASTYDGRSRPVYDWERELIGKSGQNMESSVNAVDVYCEDELDDTEGMFMQGHQSMTRRISPSSRPAFSCIRQSSTSSGEQQYSARCPPGRSRNTRAGNESNDGMDEAWVRNDQASQELELALAYSTKDLQDSQNEGHFVSRAEADRLLQLEHEYVELALAALHGR